MCDNFCRKWIHLITIYHFLQYQSQINRLKSHVNSSHCERDLNLKVEKGQSGKIERIMYMKNQVKTKVLYALRYIVSNIFDVL